MRRIGFAALMLLLAVMVPAANQLELKDITKGEFRGESMAAVKPLSDGETYAQLSSDGQRIEQYSFKTGKQVGVLFDAKRAKGAKIDNVEGYIVSPDGQRLLIQTASERIYRRSFTATYYIYSVRNNRLEPLSENGRSRLRYSLLMVCRLLLSEIITSSLSSCYTITQKCRLQRMASVMKSSTAFPIGCMRRSSVLHVRWYLLPTASNWFGCAIMRET